MRPENKNMKRFLAQHGINANPKYLPDGSLKGCWRLYDKNTEWSIQLAEKLNNLGFMDFDNKPLGEFSGNGGRFSVFVRGHDELLNGHFPPLNKPLKPKELSINLKDGETVDRLLVDAWLYLRVQERGHTVTRTGAEIAKTRARNIEKYLIEKGVLV